MLGVSIKQKKKKRTKTGAPSQHAHGMTTQEAADAASAGSGECHSLPHAPLLHTAAHHNLQ